MIRPLEGRTALITGANRGLGLAIARRAVELHKGAIRAANANPGLRIDLEFPVA